MPPPNSDDALISIRCPACGQRFKVDEDFRERTVECGSCEARFRVDEDVIIENRKFYPGERKTQSLDRFNRVPLPGVGSAIGVQPMRYAAAPPPSSFEPTNPLRILAGCAGVSGMILIALMLMFSIDPSDLLDGMSIKNRLVISGFTGFMGTMLLVYANPRARLKAGGIGSLMTMGLLILPFYFVQGSVRIVNSKLGPVAQVRGIEEELNPDSQLTLLRKRIGTTPLEEEIKQLAKKGSDKYAYGLWLKNTTSSQQYLIKDYLMRVTGADESSHSYPRERDEFLFVLTGLTITIPQLSEILMVLGDVNTSYAEIDIIEVTINSLIFEPGSIDKLTKKTDPAFYELNKRELESIELERIKRAVQRLGNAEPKIYRSDITRKLISLLKEDGIDFKADVCSALAVWSEKTGPASQAALGLVKRLMEKELPVDREIITLIIKEKNLEVIPALNKLWQENPQTWESLYGDLGAAIEPDLLGGFAATVGTYRNSSIRLIGRVGTSASLPILADALPKSDREQVTLIEHAQKAITERVKK